MAVFCHAGVAFRVVGVSFCVVGVPFLFAGVVESGRYLNYDAHCSVSLVIMYIPKYIFHNGNFYTLGQVAGLPQPTHDPLRGK